MVCLGNICRSPLGKGILESKINPKKVDVDSAVTVAYHIGKPPDPRSIEIANKNGIIIQNQKARQFHKNEFSRFSKIYVMGQSNYKKVIALTETNQEKEKVQLILEDQNEVPDPYYAGEDSFKHCFDLLNNACDRIVKSLN